MNWINNRDTITNKEFQNFIESIERMNNINKLKEIKNMNINIVSNKTSTVQKTKISAIIEEAFKEYRHIDDIKFENMIKEMQNLNQKVCCESEESCCNEVRHIGYVPGKSNDVINKPFASSITSKYYDLENSDGIYVSNSLKDFTHRELNLIYNCKSYATDSPSGLPGHNLMMIINKFCELLDIDWSDLGDAQENLEIKEQKRQNEEKLNPKSIPC